MSRISWQVSQDELNRYPSLEQWNQENKPFRLLKCIVIECQRFWRVLPKTHSGTEYTTAQVMNGRSSYTTHCKKHVAKKTAILLDETLEQADTLMKIAEEEEEEKKQQHQQKKKNKKKRKKSVLVDMTDDVKQEQIPSPTIIPRKDDEFPMDDYKEHGNLATIIEDFDKLRDESVIKWFDDFSAWETLKKVLAKPMKLPDVDIKKRIAMGWIEKYENHEIHITDRGLVRCRDLVAPLSSLTGNDFHGLDINAFTISRQPIDQKHLYLYINRRGVQQWIQRSKLPQNYKRWIVEILLHNHLENTVPSLLDDR